jgi:uncharacterized protein (DUF169 family)
MPTYAELEKRLNQHLELSTAPVAVSFHAAAPQGVEKFAGQVPSGCTFWKLAAEGGGFYTEPADHHNCSIGSYTHNIELPKERAHELTDVLGVFGQLGYVKMEEVPQIPRLAETPGFVVYARLRDARHAPDVVVFALRADVAMLLNEAARAAGVSASVEPLPRPTCMAIPATMGKGATMSFACVGNRVYTELPDSNIYMMVRGGDLEAVVTSLAGIAEANTKLTAYHEQRKTQLTQLRAR